MTCSRRNLKSVLRACGVAIVGITAVVLCNESGVIAQQAVAQATPGPSQGQTPQSGPVDFPWECYGFGASPYWDDWVILGLTGFVNNQAGATNEFAGLGSVDASVSLSFPLGRQNVTVRAMSPTAQIGRGSQRIPRALSWLAERPTH